MKINTKLIILSGIPILFLLLAYFIFRNNENLINMNYAKPKKSPLVFTVAGAVVLESFQSNDLTDNQTKQEDYNNKPTRAPTMERKEFSKHRNLNIKTSKNQVHKSIHLNGVPYIWLNTLSAKKRMDFVVKSNSPDGFEIISATSKQSLEKFNSNSLYVVTDKDGFEKKVITGVLIVELHDNANTESLAKKNLIDIVYLAPQIHTALYQVRNGQNLFDKQKTLMTSHDVKSVKIEILGKGASIK